MSRQRGSTAPAVPVGSEGPGAARVLQAVTDWVPEFAAWNVFVGLTYREEVSYEACTADLDSLLKHVSRTIVRQHVHAFWVLGSQQRGVLHSHILLAVPEPLPVAFATALHTAWLGVNRLAGTVDCQPVYDVAGAVNYALHGHDEWFLDVFCPRKRRCTRKRSCLEARRAGRREDRPV